MWFDIMLDPVTIMAVKWSGDMPDYDSGSGIKSRQSCSHAVHKFILLVHDDVLMSMYV